MTDILNFVLFSMQDFVQIVNIYSLCKITMIVMLLSGQKVKISEFVFEYLA